jgi:integrase
MVLREAVGLHHVKATFEMPKQGRMEPGRQRFFTEAEERQILALTLRHGAEDYHDLFVVLVETGVRPPKEARSLLWRDISETRITVGAAGAKTARSRKLPCSPRAREALERLRRRHGNEPGPFRWLKPDKLADFWGLLRKDLEWLNNKDCVPYTFRHTRATRWANDRALAMQGVPPAKVAGWLGHSLITHQGYVHHVEETDDYAGLVKAMYSPLLAAA